MGGAGERKRKGEDGKKRDCQALEVKESGAVKGRKMIRKRGVTGKRKRGGREKDGDLGGGGEDHER